MSDHLVDVVNEKDEVIGSELKSLKAEKGFISRVAAIFLCDKNKNIFICKRAAHKKFSPNLYDLAAVGSVLAGETYDEAAKRELKEELNIECELKLLDKFYQEAENISNDKKMAHFCAVFLGSTDMQPCLNAELSEIKKLTWNELNLEIKNNEEKFCSGFLNDFYQVKDKLENFLK